jgi:PKD repeat protein
VTVNGVIIDQNIGPATLSVNGGAPSPMTVANTQGSAAFGGTAQFNEGANSFSVTAVDKAGNTRTVTRSVTVDTVLPTISLTAPAAGAQLSGIVMVTAQAADVGTGLTGVTLLVDGQVRATDLAAPYTFSVDTLTLPAGSHTLTVQATDRAGNMAQASRGVTVRPQLRAQITSPTNGSTVLYSPILVQGTIVNNYGPAEIGLTVNGYVAETQGGKFAVDGVALAAGANTITATATDGAGVTATATANVTAVPDPLSPPIRLMAELSNGLAPAPVTFEVDAQTAFPITSYQIDFDGNGTIDFSSSSFVGVSHTYPIAGVYVPTLTVRDSQGTLFRATTVVNVWDRVTIDTLLKSKWTGMKEALFDNDIETALKSIAFTARDGYSELFMALTSQFGQVDQILPDISFVSITVGRAEYQMIRVDNGVRLSYFVLLVKDNDGIWRLKFF